MRTITIRVDAEREQDATCAETKETDLAVGYLSMWAIHNQRHCKVYIALAKDGNILASYSDRDGNETYSLFALRGDDGTYSFHS